MAVKELITGGKHVSKVAVIISSALIVNVHVKLVPEHTAPLLPHPLKQDPDFGLAVRVTIVPAA